VGKIITLTQPFRRGLTLTCNALPAEEDPLMQSRSRRLNLRPKLGERDIFLLPVVPLAAHRASPGTCVPRAVSGACEIERCSPQSAHVRLNDVLLNLCPFLPSLCPKRGVTCPVECCYPYFASRSASTITPLSKRTALRAGIIMGVLPKNEAVPPPTSVEDRLRLVIDAIPCLILRA
jgi:hypothetical protein